MITGVQLVEFVLSKSGKTPQKTLQKLAYLMEIDYIRKYGERLSDLSFRRYYYGPFSQDIANIQMLDENISVTPVLQPIYPMKVAELAEDASFSLGDGRLDGELTELLDRYKGKTGRQLEEIADETQPFLETENMNDPIDLDGYAWYFKRINSNGFWKEAIKKDEDNKKKGIYGKVIV